MNGANCRMARTAEWRELPDGANSPTARTPRRRELPDRANPKKRELPNGRTATCGSHRRRNRLNILAITTYRL